MYKKTEHNSGYYAQICCLFNIIFLQYKVLLKWEAVLV